MRFYHLETLSRAFLQNKKPQKSRIFKDFGVICRYFYMICHEKYRNVPAKCREALIFKGFLLDRLHCRELYRSSRIRDKMPYIVTLPRFLFFRFYKSSYHLPYYM